MTAITLRHSLRTRLLVWTVGVTGLILTAVIGWNYLNVLEQLEHEAQRRATFVANASADKINAELAIPRGLAQGIALTLQAQSLKLSLQQVQALQEGALRERTRIFGMAIALLPEFTPTDWPESAPYAYHAPTGIIHQDLAAHGRIYLSEDWFYMPRYLDREVWSEPYIEPFNGVKMVTYSVPIRLATASGPRFAGVVTVDIDLDWVDRTLAELPLGPGGYALLMTRNGTYISHPIAGISLNETIFSIAEARNDSALRRFGQRMVSGEPGLTPWVSWSQQEPSWFAWHPLSTVDWTIGAVVSQAELHAHIRDFSQQEVWVGLIGLVALVVAVWLLARSIARPVSALSAAAATLASGNLDADLPAPHGHDEVARLTEAFAAMRESLQRYITDLAETTAVRERMNSELRIARDIQLDLVPKTFPAFPERDDLDLFAIMEPAREVGGDFYDFFALDDARLVIAIGDVSGKGVPAALFMAVTRSFLRSGFRVEDDPAQVLARVNEDLAEGNDSCMFVTIFCAVVHLSEGWVQYANAGHNPPLLLDQQGQMQWIDAVHGPAAGAWPGVKYTAGRFRLPVGSMLLLYTDGVTEAMDSTNRLFGEDRLAERLTTCRALVCRECLTALLAAVEEHSAGIEQSDDITMLMIKRTAHVKSTEPAPTLELEIANRLVDLSGALDQLTDFLTAEQATPALIYAAQLVLEELATNIIKHGYEDADTHHIRAHFRLGPPATLRIEDDGRPFDPRVQAPDVDLESGVEDRTIGGLGLHMVRSSTASLDYCRIAGINRLDIVFAE